MPFIIAYNEADAALARRIETDLAQTAPAHPVSSVIAILSPSALADADVQRQIDAALQDDTGQLFVVLAQDTDIPSKLGHIKPLDFRGDSYPIEELRRGLFTRSAALDRSNRIIGLIVSAVAFSIFLIGLYGVGVLGIHAPQEEFEEVETARMDQRNTLIAPTLEPLIPVGQFAISQFELTVTYVPTRLREYLVQTVTATAQGTFIPTLTPRPTREN